MQLPLRIGTQNPKKHSNNFYHQIQWYSKNLALNTQSIEIDSLLTLHDRVINFTRKKHGEVLSVAHPFIYKGPSTVGVSSYAFKQVTNALKSGALKSGILSGNQLTLAYKNIPPQYFSLHHALSLSFHVESAINPNIKDKKINAQIDYIYQRLELTREKLKRSCDIDSRIVFASNISNSDSTSPNQHAPGAGFFQSQFKKHFPRLVIKLLENKNNNNLDSDWRNQADQLIGLGRGTTPSGDDMIHGCFIALNWLKQLELYAAEVPQFSEKLLRHYQQKTTKMGVHMLSTGTQGQTPEPVLDYIKLLTSNNNFEVPSNIDSISTPFERVSQMGHSTGLDILTGFTYTALKALNEI